MKKKMLLTVLIILFIYFLILSAEAQKIKIAKKELSHEQQAILKNK